MPILRFSFCSDNATREAVLLDTAAASAPLISIRAGDSSTFSIIGLLTEPPCVPVPPVTQRLSYAALGKVKTTPLAFS